MSVAVKEIIRASRPPGPLGRADKYLLDMAQDLRLLLEKSQRGLADRSLVWPAESLSELAAVLVEFGEDLHADAGLWHSLENYNREFFGTPLPLTVGNGAADNLTGFDPRRIQHLLWTLWLRMDPGGCPSPNHPSLLRLAQVAGTILTERFARLPGDSGVKNFLAGPSVFGWEIKRKLVWLGTKSYLFRWLFTNYVTEQNEGATVGITDDFICQETTGWSGLGAIDILAGALDVSLEDRATLRTWYERHALFYRVLSRQDRGRETESIAVRNLVSGQHYTVRMNVPNCPFKPGQVVFGSLHALAPGVVLVGRTAALRERAGKGGDQPAPGDAGTSARHRLPLLPRRGRPSEGRQPQTPRRVRGPLRQRSGGVSRRPDARARSRWRELNQARTPACQERRNKLADPLVWASGSILADHRFELRLSPRDRRAGRPGRPQLQIIRVHRPRPSRYAVNRSSNPENRCSVRLFFTAIPSARFCPISTTSFLPRVMPV